MPQKERDELDRIRRVYERRKTIPAERYSRISPGHLYHLHEREAVMAALLRSAGLKSLAGLRILDIGCGRGTALRQYLEYEADPARLCGIDLLPALVEQAHSLSPNLRMACASASQLPFNDGRFDLVSQFLLFTSVLDLAMKRQIAREIHRVLVPHGKLLWYDFAYNNPNNPDVRGISMEEIRQFFPNFTVHARRVTLAPPLGRLLGHFGPALYHLASQIRFVNTHYFCLLSKDF